MKKLTLLGCVLCLTIHHSYAQLQFNSPLWPATGAVGVGIATPNQQFAMQFHGTRDYIITTPPVQTPEGVIIDIGRTLNLGKTARIGLTNTVTGATTTDGTEIMQVQNDFSINNQERGALSFSSGGAMFQLHGGSGEIAIGSNASGARFNLNSNGKDGINIISTASGTYGLGIVEGSDDDDAIFVKKGNTSNPLIKFSVKGSGAVSATAYTVFASNGTTKNFAVNQNGEVFGRKYTTTLQNIPDYVFEKDYQLMPMSDLRSFLKENKHLPNIPSAKILEKEGVELGEMNRLLLEKVEELTLYILQLEQRMQQLEQK